MGLKFRKSIKLAKGVRLNVGKRGVSMTVGSKRARVTMGSNGTTVSASSPIKGLSYSTKLASGAPHQVATPREAARYQSTQPVKVSVLIDDETGLLSLRDGQNQPLAPATEKAFYKQQREALVDTLEEEVARRERIREAIENFHMAVPEALSPASYRALPAPRLTLPNPPMFPWYTRLLAMFLSGVRQKIQSSVDEHQRHCERLIQDHHQQVSRHEQLEGGRIHRFQVARLRETDAMEDYLQEELEQLQWPYETLVSFEVPDAQTLVFDVDLPEIEDLPVLKTSVAKRPLGLSFKDMSQADQSRQYMRHVHAIAFVLISMGLTRLPSVKTIIISGYTQRTNPKTARIEDTYIYSARVKRQCFERIDRANLAGLDVVECFELFELRRKMTKTGIFKPILPIQYPDAAIS